MCWVLLAAVVCPAQQRIQWAGRMANWRYSDLRHITAENVVHLRAAWSYPYRLAGPSHSLVRPEGTPLALAGFLYVVGSAGDVFALDLESGRLVWHYSQPPSSTTARARARVNPGPAAEWGRIFLVTPEGHLLALDRRNGRVAWERRMAAAGAPFTTGLGYVIVPAWETREGRPSPILCGFLSETGEPRWRTRMPATGLSARGAVHLGRDLLFWGTLGPPGFVQVNPFSGEVEAQPVRAESVMPEPEPAVVEDTVVLVPAGSAYDPQSRRWYFRDTKTIRAENSWDFPMDAPTGMLATAGGLVFAAGQDGRLVALNAQSGKLMWSHNLGTAATSAPITYLHRGKQYVAVATATGWQAFREP